MRRELSRALVATACVASVSVGAQAPARSAAPVQPPPARRFVVMGCLSRESAPARGGGTGAARFFVIDKRGPAPKTYRLDGDEATLNLHVGHLIEASGPLTAPPSGDAGPHADALIIKMSALTYISRTCK